ncbi:MAG: phenylalanine--tRNA ligase subunit alpha [Gammaproteobacteria bacterium]|nr:phenylalanine--tRNA ligase subunit alpha [Gammaproteobacteria bacterium]
MDSLLSLLEQAHREIEALNDIKGLEGLRIHYLGKKGVLTQTLKGLKVLGEEERRATGQNLNEAKAHLNEWFTAARERLENQALLKDTVQKIDVTLPGRGEGQGHLHPITQTLARVEQYFMSCGFLVAEGPEIEMDYYNFEALNFPRFHPSRALQDTFYFKDGRLLRTHASPVQIRFMETHEPPFQMMASGRVYRCDYDVSHLPMFHQTEGLMIGKGICFAELKGILDDFLRFFFERPLKSRFRPSFFPFVEPGAEMDISCILCEGMGCRACKHTGWLEILGCGMVHPNVLNKCKVDPNKWSGFAFGVGIERLAMLFYRIDDIRLFCENHTRFLKQF